MKPRICVPLPAKNFSDLLLMIRKAERAGADLIEVRLDCMELGVSDVTDILGKVVGQASVPLVATNRQYEEGGCRRQNEGQRVQILMRAAEVGFQYVDIELATVKLRSTVQRLKDYGSRPIVSFHDFKGSPKISEMERIIRSQVEAGAEICKLVTTANDVTDSIQCLLLARRMSEITKIVCFAMGKKGGLSRAFSPFFGAYFTFASLESGLETASGQMSIADLKALYRKLGVDE